MQFRSYGTKVSGILLNLFSKIKVGGDASINFLQYSGTEGDLRYLRLMFLKFSNFEVWTPTLRILQQVCKHCDRAKKAILHYSKTTKTDLAPSKGKGCYLNFKADG